MDPVSRKDAIRDDLLSALSLLTRLPVPDHLARGARAAWAWPLAGALVAGLAGVTGGLATWAGTPPAVAAGLMLALQAALTGALHEDGLADSADALWGGRDRARRLAIMKDSRIGTYGALALIFSAGLRWAALTALVAADQGLWALVAAAALSRAAMIWPIAALPPARPEGLSAAVGRPTGAGLALACAIAAGLAGLCVGGAVIPAVLALTLTTLIVTRRAKALIGGQTGDILGAAQQLAEIATLIVLATVLG